MQTIANRPSRQNRHSVPDLHQAHRLAQALGELGEEIRLEVRAIPVIEDKTQIGKAARLQKQEAVDVVFVAAFRAGEVVRARRHPVFQAVEQRLANLAPALGATGLAEKTLVRGKDAALGHHRQAIDGPPKRQRLLDRDTERQLQHLPRTLGQRATHAIATRHTGAQLRFDNALLAQPTQHLARPPLGVGIAGDLRHDNALLLQHGALLAGEKGCAA